MGVLSLTLTLKLFHFPNESDHEPNSPFLKIKVLNDGKLNKFKYEVTN
jgi:hypothetical protein